MIGSVKVAATLAVAAAIGASTAVPVASASSHAPIAAAAKTCSRGTQGVINGSVRCLYRGEYCTRSADRQYRHYGLRCIRRYSNGRYRLT